MIINKRETEFFWVKNRVKKWNRKKKIQILLHYSSLGHKISRKQGQNGYQSVEKDQKST